MNLTATMYYDDLVARCKDGDVRGYEVLYNRYAKAMFNTSLRIVNDHSDAEDVLQEAFTAVFTHLGQFDYSSSFGAWLKRIVVNKSIDVLRKRKVIKIDIEETSAAAVADEQIEEENIELKVEEIRKAMTHLPNGYRTILSLVLFEGYTYEETAETLNISGSTVRTQYHRAKQKLLHLLQKGGLR